MRSDKVILNTKLNKISQDEIRKYEIKKDKMI